MMCVALFSGERLGLLTWCGYLLALAGVAYLLCPGLGAQLGDAFLMAVAGIHGVFIPFLGENLIIRVYTR